MYGILLILLIMSHSGELTKVAETHLAPETRVFDLLLQSPADVRITTWIDLGLQALPEAPHFFRKRNTLIITIL